MDRLTIIFLFLPIFSSCMKDNTQEFTPIVWDGESYHEDSTLKNNSFKTNIPLVLDFYSEPYSISGDKILISPELSENLDLRANYTKKALDHRWMEEHINN